MTTVRTLLLGLGIAGIVVVAISGAYWWSNTPPKRPKGVSENAVFLWAGHLGLPAPRHGTWLECWADTANRSNRCRLTEMDGKFEYEGVFLADSGQPMVPQSDLKILSEATGQNINLWVRINGDRLVPLVFLQDRLVLIPKDAYSEGLAKLVQLHQEMSQ